MEAEVEAETVVGMEGVDLEEEMEAALEAARVEAVRVEEEMEEEMGEVETEEAEEASAEEAMEAGMEAVRTP